MALKIKQNKPKKSAKVYSLTVLEARSLKSIASRAILPLMALGLSLACNSRSRVVSVCAWLLSLCVYLCALSSSYKDTTHEIKGPNEIQDDFLLRSLSTKKRYHFQIRPHSEALAQAQHSHRSLSAMTEMTSSGCRQAWPSGAHSPRRK